MKLTLCKEMTGPLHVYGVFTDEQDVAEAIMVPLQKARQSKKFLGNFGQTYQDTTQEATVLLVGLGDKDTYTLEHLRRALAVAVRWAQSQKSPLLCTNILQRIPSLPNATLRLGRAAAEAALLATYQFERYLNKERQTTVVEEIKFLWSGPSLGTGLQQGRSIAEATNFARDLVNEPANIVNAPYLEKVARSLARHKKISLTVLETADLKKAGMHALLGVNAGSIFPPKLLILHYKNSGPLTALVGKGVTFDSGGYNLKPTRGIENMKTDMAGGAAVLGAIKAAADLDLPKNLLGVIPVVENMVSSKAQRPGDIVRACNGTTIEITNTDAEGRLILADSLAYIQKKYNPSTIIDLATLTGAVVVALGHHNAGLVSPDDELAKQLYQAGIHSGDRVWQLPFSEDYQDHMKGSISDLQNTASYGKGYEAGSITAAVFLSKFVDTTKAAWAHIDIAGAARFPKQEYYTPSGATGAGVRTLLYYLLGDQ